MSTPISNLVTKLNDVIPTVTGFSTKKLLENPYDLEECSPQRLSNGWGIRVGSIDLTPLSTHEKLLSPQFRIILTRSISGSDTQNSIREREVMNVADDIYNLVVFLDSNTAWEYTEDLIDVSSINTSDPVLMVLGKTRVVATEITFVARLSGVYL